MQEDVTCKYIAKELACSLHHVRHYVCRLLKTQSSWYTPSRDGFLTPNRTILAINVGRLSNFTSPCDGCGKVLQLFPFWPSGTVGQFAKKWLEFCQINKVLNMPSIWGIWQRFWLWLTVYALSYDKKREQQINATGIVAEKHSFIHQACSIFSIAIWRRRLLNDCFTQPTIQFACIF